MRLQSELVFQHLTDAVHIHGQIYHKTLPCFQAWQSVEFFWKILDIEKKGYITIFTLNYFFRGKTWCMCTPRNPYLPHGSFEHAPNAAVRQRMIELGHEPVDVLDVVASEVMHQMK